MPSPARHGVQHGRYNDGEGAREPDEEGEAAREQAEQQQDVPGQEQLEAEEVHQVDRRGRPAEDGARQPRRRAVRAVEEREVVREEEVREAEHMDEVHGDV